MREASHIFFNKKYWHILDINVWNLTNEVVNFEQSGLEIKNLLITDCTYLFMTVLTHKQLYLLINNDCTYS